MQSIYNCICPSPISVFTTRHSWNIAKVGVKHELINYFFKLSEERLMLYCLPLLSEEWLMLYCLPLLSKLLFPSKIFIFKGGRCILYLPLQKKTIGEANKNPPKIPLLYVVFYLGVILPFTVQFLFSILNLLLNKNATLCYICELSKQILYLSWLNILYMFLLCIHMCR